MSARAGTAGGGATGEWPALALAVAGAAGLAGAAVLLAVRPDATVRGWHVAVLSLGMIPLGGLVLLCAADLTGGGWRAPLFAPFAAAAGLVPATLIALAPLLLVLGNLFPWAGGSEGEGAFRAVWFDGTVFAVRTVLLLAVLSAFALVLARSRSQRPGMAAAALVFGVPAISLLAFDWGMSVSAHYHSGVYGLLFTQHLVLGATALAVLAVVLPRPGQAPPAGLGALFLSMVLLWAYFHAMQVLVGWSGDLPDVARWYIHRGTGVWLAVAIALGTLQGLVPLAVLLLPAARTGGRPLLALAALTLAMRPLEVAWLVLPGHGAGPATGLAVLLGTLAAGGAFGAGFMALLRSARFAPPRREARDG